MGWDPKTGVGSLAYDVPYQQRRSDKFGRLLTGGLISMDLKTLYVRLLAQIARLKEENGQDLVEYALIVALIAFAAIVGMRDLANGINSAFNQIANTVNTYL